MKNPLIALLVSCLLFFVPAVAKVPSWEAAPRSASGALFAQYPDGVYRFHCSVENVKQEGPDMIASTARHCVYHDASEGSIFEEPHDAGFDGVPIEVTYHSDESGPFYPADVIAIAANDDIAIIRVKGAANSTVVVPLGDSNKLEPGDALVNYGYPQDLGKLRFDMKVVSPYIPHFSDGLKESVPEWSHGMLVEGDTNHGQSGSGIYDVKTHALVGILVGLPGDNILTVAEPSNRLARLLAGQDSVPYSAPAPKPEAKQ